MNKAKPTNRARLALPLQSILFILLIGGIGVQTSFAEEERTANVRDNWVSGELSLFGLGIRYERMLGSHFSLGVNAYANLDIIWNDFGIDASARLYPWGETFFVGVGVGPHRSKRISLTYDYNMDGVAVTPELGWKIDVGDEGGSFLQPGVKVPITFGAAKYTEEPFLDFKDEGPKEGVAHGSIGIVIYLGIGSAF